MNTPKLIVNPDSPDAWEIQLKPGVNTFGRTENNDFPIVHPSVSTTHCEIQVTKSEVLVKDLGSINGTFIGNRLVEQALLLPGQILRLGDVRMRFENNSETRAGEASQNVTTNTSFCKSHPKAAGQYYCAKCAQVFCELCVNTRIVNGQPTKLCRACGGECTSLLPEEVIEPPKFWRLAGGAFAYPFKNDGLILLAAGTVFYLAIDFLATHAFFLGILVSIAGTGYLFNYLQRILSASAMGENKMPDWPDFSDWSDVTGPFLQCLATVLFSFGPVILLKLAAPANAAWLNWAMPTAIVWGCMYFPMAFTAITMFDSIGALNPLLVIPSILRIAATYWLAILLLAVTFAANWFAGDFFQTVLPIPYLPTIISEFLGLYLLAVEMRILGLLYWTKKSKLGWFAR